MSTLLFRLRNVPDDEVNEIRELLKQQGIACFETSAGNWGIGMPAIWAEDDADVPRARELIENYQHARSTAQREEHELRKARGQVPTVFESILARPGMSIAILLFSAFILYVMFKPIMQMINYQP